MSVTTTILDAHRYTREPPAAELGAAMHRWLRPDHVVLDQDAVPLVLASCRALSVSRFSPDLVLVGGGDLDSLSTLPPAAEMLAVLARARAGGAHVARPGSASAAHLYHDRHAAPGKLAMVSTPGVSIAGALGALELGAGALEMAAVLAGGPLDRRLARPTIVRLWGNLPPWVSGLDLALELGRRLPAGGASGGILELSGIGVGSLRMSDRTAIVAQRGMLGASAVVFPSDEITRRHLRALGRESDWKRLEAEEMEEGLVVDLEAIEPLLTRAAASSSARLVRHAVGTPVARIRIGTRATAADLGRLEHTLAGRELAPHVELSVALAGRAFESAARLEALQKLERRGVRITEPGAPPPGRRSSSLEGVELVFGGASGRPDADADVYLASIETCAAAALTGRVTDPRELDVEFRRDEEPESLVSTDDPLLAPASDSAVELRNGTVPVTPLGRPLEGSLRGTVLIALGDDVGVDRILPWGPRMEPIVADVGALGARTLAAVAPRFDARARAHDGGFVVAGLMLGSGERSDETALAWVELGVRAVMARSFATEFHTALLHAGVLPLRFRIEADLRSLRAGDELELPGLPEDLHPGKPVVLRNLTRGTQCTVQHDLDAIEIAIARAGGLLRFAQEAAAARVPVAE